MYSGYVHERMRCIYRLYFIFDVIYWIVKLRCQNSTFLECIASAYGVTQMVDKVKIVLLIHLVGLATYFSLMILSKILQLPYNLVILVRGFGYFMLATVLVIPNCRFVDMYIVAKAYVLLETTICSLTVLDYVMFKVFSNEMNE